MSFAMGKYFEDFHEGEEIRTLGRTVTEADVVNFSGFSGDFNPLHTDAQYAAQQAFKGRIAHGMCGFSIAVGLLVRTNIFEGTILAFFGIENWRFRAPIMLGDTIHAIARVVKKRETSKPDRGLIVFDCNVINQKEILTMSGRLHVMIMRRPA